MSKKPRHAGVLRAVAELADWKDAKLEPGRARGVAVVESFNTFVAQVVELSMTDGRSEGAQGLVRGGLRRRRQSRTSSARRWKAASASASVTSSMPKWRWTTGGRVTTGNFDSYRSLRINEMPEIEVTIVKSTEKPTRRR